jgi:hypothetical protein
LRRMLTDLPSEIKAADQRVARVVEGDPVIQRLVTQECGRDPTAPGSTPIACDRGVLGYPLETSVLDSCPS